MPGYRNRRRKIHAQRIPKKSFISQSPMTEPANVSSAATQSPVQSDVPSRVSPTAFTNLDHTCAQPGHGKVAQEKHKGKGDNGMRRGPSRWFLRRRESRRSMDCVPDSRGKSLDWLEIISHEGQPLIVWQGLCISLSLSLSLSLSRSLRPEREGQTGKEGKSGAGSQ